MTRNTKKNAPLLRHMLEAEAIRRPTGRLRKTFREAHSKLCVEGVEFMVQVQTGGGALAYEYLYKVGDETGNEERRLQAWDEWARDDQSDAADNQSSDWLWDCEPLSDGNEGLKSDEDAARKHGDAAPAKQEPEEDAAPLEATSWVEQVRVGTGPGSQYHKNLIKAALGEKPAAELEAYLTQLNVAPAALADVICDLNVDQLQYVYVVLSPDRCSLVTKVCFERKDAMFCTRYLLAGGLPPGHTLEQLHAQFIEVGTTTEDMTEVLVGLNDTQLQHALSLLLDKAIVGVLDELLKRADDSAELARAVANLPPASRGKYFNRIVNPATALRVLRNVDAKHPVEARTLFATRDAAFQAVVNALLASEAAHKVYEEALKAYDDSLKVPPVGAPTA